MHRSPHTFRTGAVTSQDGTTLGYRWGGNGPACVLWHGSMLSSGDLLRLGSELSRDFTVVLPDRRGRGLSGPYGEQFSLQREAEDVHAVAEHTGTQRLFAHSSGALPILLWARDAPAETLIALYEPPPQPTGPAPVPWFDRYDRAMQQGHTAAALATLARDSGDSRLLPLLPHPVLRPLMYLALHVQSWQAAVTGGVQLRDLVPTMYQDAQLLGDADAAFRAAATVRGHVLLLGGSRSPRPLHDARAVPDARSRTLRHAGHLGPTNGGRPEPVAQLLSAFFAGWEV